MGRLYTRRESIDVWKRRDPIENVRIATPCSMSWERMEGDERVRHCTSCDLNVYNFAAMTRAEIRELLLRSEGRICGRLYRRADGTLLTKDCPRGIRALQQRVSRFASAMMATLLSFTALATGCATDLSEKADSQVTLESEPLAAPQHAVFEGTVVDHTGTPIPGVTVVLRNETAKSEIAVVSDTNGAFAIGSWTEGLYRVEAQLDGFRPAVAEHVELKQNASTRAHVVLRLDGVLESITVGAMAAEPRPGTTTITREMLDRIPF